MHATTESMIRFVLALIFVNQAIRFLFSVEQLVHWLSPPKSERLPVITDRDRRPCRHRIRGGLHSEN